MPTLDEVAELVQRVTSYRGPLKEETILQSDIGVYGDDMDQLLAAYSKQFNVDLTGYVWYFHTGEDVCNPGALFFRPPNMRVKEIPITIGMLHQFAESGRWAIDYPLHELPRLRWDVWTSWGCLLALMMAFGMCCCSR